MTAVIFDMDGLLLDTERLAFEALQTVSARFGASVPKDTFLSMIGLNKVAGGEILRRTLGADLDIAEFSDVWDAEIDSMTVEHVPLRPGAYYGVWSLAVAGVPLAVATSTSRSRALKKLEKAGLLEAFSAVTCGDEVARSKPEPDIFLEAARRINVDPSECWAFEDSANGTRAAIAAGMNTVQVPDLLQPDDALRALGHHIAPDLTSGLAHAGFLPPRRPAIRAAA